MIHDFLDYNPSKARILQIKQANAERQRQFRMTQEVTRDETRDKQRPVPSRPRREEKRREEREEYLSTAACRPDPLLLENEVSKNGLRPVDLIELWKHHCPKCPAPRKLGPKRQRRAAAVIREHSRDEIVQAMHALNASPFCTGDNPRAWRADLEFFLRPGNVDRLIEGSFAVGTSGSKIPDAAEIERIIREGRRHG